MKLSIHSPAKALSKAYLRQSLKREQIEQFKENLKRMFERIRSDEHEEHLKNILSDFLKDTWYKQSNEINIPALEAEIDRLVYALYGLADEEVAVVEGKR